MISIGDVKAAVKPFFDGSAWIIWACLTTCCLTPASHWSADCAVGNWKSGPRSSSGFSIDGRVLKNSTPAEKSLIASPVLGSSTMPPGTEAKIYTPSGPSSEMANLMPNPPAPAMEKPPSTPTKKIRFATGVVMSKLSIMKPLASSLMMPPIRPALISPPNRLPLIETPIAAMSMTGNSPFSNLPTSILIPSIAPENSSPPTPCRPVTAAESVNTKSAGSFRMSGQVTPISVILIGSQLGHLKSSPVAAPTLMNTPKPGLGTKVPSPRKAKLRPSPPSVREPMVNSAPSERKLTISSLAAAEVSMKTSVALNASTEPKVMRSVSTLKTRPLTLPFSNSRATRIASVFGTPGAMSGSAVRRSLMVAETALPGKSLAPPEAMNIVPSKSTAWPKVTLKLVTPIRRSSNSSIPAKPILPVPPEVWVVFEPPPLPGL